MKFIRNLLILSVIAIVAFVKFYRIEGVDQLRLQPRGAGASMMDDLRAMLHRSGGSSPNRIVDPLGNDPLMFPAGFQIAAGSGSVPGKIRLGTFNLHEFSRDKVTDAERMDYIARLLREMDVVALQEIDPDRRELLPKIVEHLNRTGRAFDFLAGPKIGPVGHEQRLAFVFDRQRVEVDRKQTYTMSDPENQMAYEPLVAWFRTAGISPSSAWTFSMANIYIDPDNPGHEQSLLKTIMHSLQRDGRGEDDVVLAGCFFASDHELLPQMPADTSFALEATPSDIYARRQTSNIVFNRANTTEFLGNSGAIDFLRQYNMTIAEAEAISDHLPVWAEFQINEDQQVL